MPTDSLSRLLETVTKTTNTEAGIKKIIEATRQAIDELDEAITIDLAQRDEAARILGSFVGLYNAMVTEDSKIEIPNVPLPTATEVRRYDHARAAVLEQASRHGSRVTDEQVLTLLKAVVVVPWRNPKAVIGTILTRSGKWTRVERGVYEKVAD